MAMNEGDAGRHEQGALVLAREPGARRAPLRPQAC
jgi:hypothetical protein